MKKGVVHQDPTTRQEPGHPCAEDNGMGPKRSGKDFFKPTLLPTLRWLYDLMDQCPNWKAQWTKRLHGGQDPTLVTFFESYHHLASLVDAMPHAHDAGDSAFQSMERVLVAQFPIDPAWKNAIRHRAGLIRSKDKSRKHGAAYLPRILAERRNAVVLIRNHEGVWHSQKNAKASQVLRQSSDVRREFLETLMNIPSLQRIEIPQHMDFSGAAPIAIEVKHALATQTKVAMAARKQGRTWGLALRRIQSMGLNGCFDAASQTVIVDPRHLESMKHEVCHWLLNHGIETEDRKRFSDREIETEALTEKIFPPTRKAPPTGSVSP